MPNDWLTPPPEVAAKQKEIFAANVQPYTVRMKTIPVKVDPKQEGSKPVPPESSADLPKKYWAVIGPWPSFLRYKRQLEGKVDEKALYYIRRVYQVEGFNPEQVEIVVLKDADPDLVFAVESHLKKKRIYDET